MLCLSGFELYYRWVPLLRKHVSDENASINHLYCKIDHHQISPCLNAL